jgi:DNA-3-methyladenine glycosylase I
MERDYHDREWGVPVADERTLFEFVTLEGAQAGLAWRTVLAKRDGYREAFAGFDWTKVARYDARRVERLLGNAGIVRHRGKIESTIANARAIVALHRGRESLGGVAWAVVGGRPRSPRPRVPADIPARTADSDALAKTLRARGFRFLGSTTCYAFMQACGLTNDHLPGCRRHAPVEALGRAFVAPAVGSEP